MRQKRKKVRAAKPKRRAPRIDLLEEHAVKQVAKMLQAERLAHGKPLLSDARLQKLALKFHKQHFG